MLRTGGRKPIFHTTNPSTIANWARTHTAIVIIQSCSYALHVQFIVYDFFFNSAMYSEKPY